MRQRYTEKKLVRESWKWVRHTLVREERPKTFKEEIDKQTNTHL